MIIHWTTKREALFLKITIPIKKWKNKKNIIFFLIFFFNLSEINLIKNFFFCGFLYLNLHLFSIFRWLAIYKDLRQKKNKFLYQKRGKKIKIKNSIGFQSSKNKKKLSTKKSLWPFGSAKTFLYSLNIWNLSLVSFPMEVKWYLNLKKP